MPFRTIQIPHTLQKTKIGAQIDINVLEMYWSVCYVFLLGCENLERTADKVFIGIHITQILNFLKRIQNQNQKYLVNVKKVSL